MKVYCLIFALLFLTGGLGVILYGPDTVVSFIAGADMWICGIVLLIAFVVGLVRTHNAKRYYRLINEMYERTYDCV